MSLAATPVQSSSDDFAGLAQGPANAPWRYVLSAALIIGGGLAASFALFYGATRFGLTDVLASLTDPDALAKRPLGDRLFAFLALVWGVIVFLPLARVVLPFVHRRSWRSFVTVAPRFRWALAAKSFAVVLALLGVSLVLQLLIAPASVRYTPPDTAFFALALVGVLVLPFQALTEEVLFRGYLTQLTGRLTRSRLLRVAVPATLFTLAHTGNPEMTHDAIWAVATYALAGVYLGILVARTNGLEASFGLHFASNLFVLLIASPSVSVFPARGLFTDIDSDFRLSFIASALVFALHYTFVCGLPVQATGLHSRD